MSDDNYPSHQRGVGYFRSLSGPLGNLYTGGSPVQEGICSSTTLLGISGCWLLHLKNNKRNCRVRNVSFSVFHLTWFKPSFWSTGLLHLNQGCKNAGKYAYFPCHWYLPAFMANMVANMAYMVNSMDSYQI